MNANVAAISSGDAARTGCRAPNSLRSMSS